VLKDCLLFVAFIFIAVIIGIVRLFRSTPPIRPNKVGLKCPSVRPSVRPQKVS